MVKTIKQLINDYAAAAHRLLLLDYDGTLTPLQAHPSLARPSPTLLALLNRLASNPKNTVVIISGRDQPTLETWLGQLPLTFVAEHGAFMKTPQKEWQALSSPDNTWKDVVHQHMHASTARLPGSHIEIKATSLVWHYRQADHRQAQQELTVLTTLLQPHAQKHNLTVMSGAQHLEIKTTGTNKGTAATLLTTQKPWDFIAAVGDEPTDEDMFTALPKTAFTVKIGSGDTAAAMRLANSANFLALLEQLAEL